MYDSITKYIDEEKDVSFLVGLEKEPMKFVGNLLTESNFTIYKIAKIAGVTITFVKSIQRQLSAK